MKKILIALFAVLFGVIASVPEAEARRFGGSRSFGMQRDSGTYSKPTAPTRDAGSTSRSDGSTATTTPQRRSWLGPLAGLAAGLGIAGLLSHFGLGEEFAGLVMLALLVFGGMMLMRMLFRPARPLPAGAGPARAAATASAFEAADTPGGAVASAQREGFDSAEFERQAKLNFIRLQAAYDRGELDDIRDFTTPEVFAEIALQLEERGEAPNRTDVLELDAAVLDLGEEAGGYLASVRFRGLLRESPDEAPLPFSEVWHLRKSRAGGGWRVAGIQQD